MRRNLSETSARFKADLSEAEKSRRRIEAGFKAEDDERRQKADSMEHALSGIKTEMERNKKQAEAATG